MQLRPSLIDEFFNFLVYALHTLQAIKYNPWAFMEPFSRGVWAAIVCIAFGEGHALPRLGRLLWPTDSPAVGCAAAPMCVPPSLNVCIAACALWAVAPNVYVLMRQVCEHLPAELSRPEGQQSPSPRLLQLCCCVC